jgi:hypothetical protein
MKIENVIDENKCIRLCECGDARMGGRYCNCGIERREEMKHDIILVNYIFEM